MAEEVGRGLGDPGPQADPEGLSTQSGWAVGHMESTRKCPHRSRDVMLRFRCWTLVKSALVT